MLEANSLASLANSLATSHTSGVWYLDNRLLEMVDSLARGLAAEPNKRGHLSRDENHTKEPESKKYSKCNQAALCSTSKKSDSRGSLLYFLWCPIGPEYKDL